MLKKRATPKVMQLLDRSTGLMKCSVLIASIILLGACGSTTVPFAPSANDLEAKSFNIPKDQTAIYIVNYNRSTLSVVRLWVNGQFISALGQKTYATVVGPKGRYIVYVVGNENADRIVVTADEERPYFVRVKFDAPGLWSETWKLEMLNEQEGKAAVLESMRVLTGVE
jgi:hypothetical protein